MGTYEWGKIAREAPKGFEPVPAGDYNVECTDAQPKKFQSGNHGVVLEVTIEDGPQKGKKIKFVHLVLTPTNPGVFVGQLRAFGIGPAFFDEFGSFDDDDEEAIEELTDAVAEEIVGKRALAPVTQEPYEGRINNKVGFFKEIKEGTSSPGDRRRRSSTPDPEPPADAEASEEGGESAPPAEGAKRTRGTRSRRSAEPGLPPGL